MAYDDDPISRSTAVRAVVILFMLAGAVSCIVLWVWAAQNHGLGGLILALTVGSAVIMFVARIASIVVAMPFAAVAAKQDEGRRTPSRTVAAPSRPEPAKWESMSVNGERYVGQVVAVSGGLQFTSDGPGVEFELLPWEVLKGYTLYDTTLTVWTQVFWVLSIEPLDVDEWLRRLGAHGIYQTGDFGRPLSSN